jgi:cytochrome P450
VILGSVPQLTSGGRATGGGRISDRADGVAVKGNRRALVGLLRTLVSDEGRRDPFAVYERFREHGPLVDMPWGASLALSQRVCRQVLTRQGRLVVDEAWRDAHVPGPASSAKEGLGETLLAKNPTEHTRLRREFGQFLSGDRSPACDRSWSR